MHHRKDNSTALKRKIIMPSVILAILFFATAVLYASVGFGGGSTYTALLVFSGLPVASVPIYSLCCNLAVTAIGTFRCFKAKLYHDEPVGIILFSSVPAAFLGGLTPIRDQLLLLLLAMSLLIAGIQLGWSTITKPKARTAQAVRTRRNTVIALFSGVGVGYLSGLVGIGGGIFLAPVLHALNWSSPRRIAATATVYIAANSVSALAGKFISNRDTLQVSSESALLLWLVPAVLIGGTIGHRFLLGIFPERIVKALTAILILIVAVRLFARVI